MAQKMNTNIHLDSEFCTHDQVIHETNLLFIPELCMSEHNKNMPNISTCVLFVTNVCMLVSLET